MIWFCVHFIWPYLNKAIEERQIKIAEGLNAADVVQHVEQLLVGVVHLRCEVVDVMDVADADDLSGAVLVVLIDVGRVVHDAPFERW